MEESIVIILRSSFFRFAVCSLSVPSFSCSRSHLTHTGILAIVGGWGFQAHLGIEKADIWSSLKKFLSDQVHPEQLSPVYLISCGFILFFLEEMSLFH